jgi:DNA polymerase-1
VQTPLLSPSFIQYNSFDTLATRRIWDALTDEAKELGVYDFYLTNVQPLARAVMAMSQHGLLVDRAERWQLALKFRRHTKHQRAMLPAELDPDSPQKIGRWLTDTLGMKPIKVTEISGQVSTDEDSLRKMYEKNPDPRFEALLAYREATKIYRTYLKGIPIDRDGKVRSRWLVHGTATGRLSSRRPNLQNVPKAFRTLYVATPGWRLAELDYSQIELRIIAHLAQDERLLEAFANGEDIHTVNANALAGYDTTGDERWRTFAKVFVYGVVMYGGSPRTVPLDPTMLALVPNGRKDLERLADRYFREHPAITQWRTNTAQAVRREGRLYNWAGRCRIFFGHSHDRIKAGYNFPIQSGAADIINRSLVDITNTVRATDARVIAQIHDALLVEYRDEGALRDIQTIMEFPVEIDGRGFRVPTKVKVGNCWGRLEEWNG